MYEGTCCNELVQSDDLLLRIVKLNATHAWLLKSKSNISAGKAAVCP